VEELVDLEYLLIEILQYKPEDGCCAAASKYPESRASIVLRNGSRFHDDFRYIKQH
jgi:hypothetical protein